MDVDREGQREVEVGAQEMLKSGCGSLERGECVL